MGIREVIATVEVLGVKSEDQTLRAILRGTWSELKKYEVEIEVEAKAEAKARSGRA